MESIFEKSSHANLLKVKEANDLSEDDNYFLFDLYRSRLNQLLFFVLSQNEQNLMATTLDTVSQERRNFARIAYVERDA